MDIKLILWSRSLFCCLIANTTYIDAQNGIVWKCKTKGVITSSPLVYSGKVFFGCDDSCLYCRDAKTGDAIWNYKTTASVLSTPVCGNNVVFFESGNILYALNTNSGAKIWRFDPASNTWADKIDPWDYHHSSPVIDDTVVYYGCGNGILYGIKITNGSVLLKYPDVNYSPIRSTPFVHRGVIYFGDWSGRLYALDIVTRDTMWTYRITDEMPYETFGAFVSGFAMYRNLLFFGTRTNTVKAIDIITGKEKWLYTDPSGSWMPGDPVIYDSIVYIGGSDNHAFLAFNANTGEKIWSYPAEQNIFTRSIAFDRYIVLSSGLGGTFNEPNPYSKGYLVEREKPLNFQEANFSSHFRPSIIYLVNSAKIFLAPAFNRWSIFLKLNPAAASRVLTLSPISSSR